jgi:putative transposase
VQRFISIHDPIANLFHFPRHEMTSAEYRTLRSEVMTIWSEVAAVPSAT